MEINDKTISFLLRNLKPENWADAMLNHDLDKDLVKQLIEEQAKAGNDIRADVGEIVVSRVTGSMQQRIRELQQGE